MHFEMESLREGYHRLAAEVLAHGVETSPRGLRTRELLGASFTCHNPVDSLVSGTGRGIVKALAAAETLQLIGGFHDPEALVRAAPHFANYLSEDGKQRAPYGPRLAEQLPVAIERLRQDPDTRQAQVTVWQPELDNALGLHDYPCTTSLQWLLRGGRLHMVVHMRSNDLFLGTPYDVFQFTQLQLTIANVLGVEPGSYHHSAASLHLYEKHWDRARELEAPTGDGPPTFGIQAGTWDEAVMVARRIHDDAEPLGFAATSPGEKWLHMAMASVHGRS